MKPKWVLWIIGVLTLQGSPSLWAQAWPAVGLYQIVSGTFTACCGIGGQFVSALPDGRQSYIELAVDAEAGQARMAVLGPDLQTVFSAPLGSPSLEFTYSLTNGLVLADAIRFESPIQVPENPSWTISLSNSGGGLTLQGEAVIPLCCDFPTRFSHTNVVAVLVSTLDQPTFALPRRATNGAVLVTVIHGAAGRTNVIEGSNDLLNWTPVSTNVFPLMSCPVCPFIDFEADANPDHRFFRSHLLP